MPRKASNIYHLALESKSVLTFGPSGRGAALAKDVRPENIECMGTCLLRAMSSEQEGHGREGSGAR